MGAGSHRGTASNDESSCSAFHDMHRVHSQDWRISTIISANHWGCTYKQVPGSEELHMQGPP